MTAGASDLPGGETSRTLDRGLRLLDLLAGSGESRTVTQLSASLGASRAAVYRLVATLEEHSLVHRDHGGRVRIGLGVLHLARAVRPLLRQAANPVLRRLAEDLGATAHLTIAEGDEALAVAVVEPSWTDVHVAYRVGSRHPLARGAAGRAITAGRSLHLLPAPAPAWFVSEGELQAGAWGLAAPVLGVPDVEASVGVVALVDLDATRAGPRVVRAASEVAAALI